MSDINTLLEELNNKIEEIQEENLALETALNALKRENDKKENKNKKWQPQEQESYYYINSLGQICGEIYAEAHEDLWRKMNGNCFPTREQADQYLENLKTKAELKALADELNGGEVIDWTDEKQWKYTLLLNCYTNVLWPVIHTIHRNPNAIYCLDENLFEKAIERIGEQRLIDMIKAGV
jgi:hypothetical protein